MSTIFPNALTCKFALAGAERVGKSRLIEQYTESKIQEARIQAVGASFYTLLDTAEVPPIRLSIWDICVKDRFHPLQDDYFDGVHAVGLVYDVTAPATFFDLMRLYEDIQCLVPRVPMLVIGNKIDLRSVVPPEEARGWAESLGIGFALTSARTGEGLMDVFTRLRWLAREEQSRRASTHRAPRPTRQ